MDLDGWKLGCCRLTGRTARLTQRKANAVTVGDLCVDSNGTTVAAGADCIGNSDVAPLAVVRRRRLDGGASGRYCAASQAKAQAKREQEAH